jgi:alpha-glucosidase
LRLRRSLPELRSGAFAWLSAPPDCLGFRRGTLTVLLNAGSAAVDLPAGQVLLASGPLHAARLPPDTAVWVRAG